MSSAAEHLDVVIVGAGRTGVELAGQVRELAVRCLKGEFRTFDPASVRVLLLDGGKEPLANFGDRLSGKASKELRRLGVELRMNARVVADTALLLRRRCSAEHPFGTMKRMMAGRFLTKGLGGTRTEMALSVLAFNMIRSFSLRARPS